MANYPGAMPVLVETLEKKRVRFDESRFGYGEITYLNKNVVILRGAANEVVERAFHGDEGCLARKKLRKGQAALREARLISAPQHAAFLPFLRKDHQGGS
jgi:hypothetical protein